MLRPACPLPPKRLSTPRSVCHLSMADWGLLPGTPVSTRSGLPPAGTTQLPGRNMPASLRQVPLLSDGGKGRCGTGVGARGTLVGATGGSSDVAPP
jgi:hypothetical protein